ncbi:Copper type II ascorbate-dependent monooxygenase-like protein, partial [Sarcoptes scabiei]
HFRGNQELKPIAVENNFDFNFQDFRRFSEKLIILPGDQITVECTYDTKKLNRPIFGGLSTQEEMCMVFMLYYPRMKGIRTCLSGLTPETVMKLSNIYSVQSLDENDMNPIILEPSLYANMSLSHYVLEKNDWQLNSSITENELIHLIRYAPQKAQCFWRKIEGIDGIEGMNEIVELISYPRSLQSYRSKSSKCK